MKNSKPWLPLVLLFILLNAVFLLGKSFFASKGFSHEVLIGGNLVLFAASFLSFYISYRSVNSTSPGAAVRPLYASFMVKFFLIAVVALVYIMSAKKDVNKPSLYICMGLYIVYTAIEVISLQRLLRSRYSGDSNNEKVIQDESA